MKINNFIYIALLAMTTTGCADYGIFNQSRSDLYSDEPVTIYDTNDKPIFKTITPTSEGKDNFLSFKRGSTDRKQRKSKEWKMPRGIGLTSRFGNLSFGFDYGQYRSQQFAGRRNSEYKDNGITYYNEALKGKYSLLQAQDKFIKNLYPGGKITETKMIHIDNINCVQTIGEYDGYPYVIARCPIYVNNTFGIAEFTMGMTAVPDKLKLKLNEDYNMTLDYNMKFFNQVINRTKFLTPVTQAIPNH